jgi:hypothetical protein
MKRGVCIVSAWCLALALYTAALAQVAYPPLLAAEVAPYPGAAVIMSGKDGTTLQVLLQTSDAPDKVMAHYRAGLTAKGWETAHEMDMPQAKTIAFTRGEADLAVAVVPQEGGPNLITLSLETQ